jgi:alkane 1-monooxygenase
MDIAPFFAGVISLLFFNLLLVTGNGWVAIWVSFVVVPFADKYLPEDRKNVNPANLKSFEKDWRFTIPLIAGYILDTAALIYIMVGLSNGTLGTTLWDFLTVLLSSGLVLGVFVPCISHELYHRRNKFFKLLGLIGHMKFLSGHIPIYHNEQHHKFTGIKGKDPGYPARGTTAFDIVEFFGYYGIKETYLHEERRLKKRGIVNLTDRLLANRVIRYRAVEIVYLIALYLTLGWKALVF